ncbi:uncharacterized protein LOC107045392 [Diachasma alloeum]|uniref:uncharacterized protein LOC107045392 n=1 Tax=Diachasma alloeum TaxID=454923 RepID=UPI00073819B2|nr:uncharacterized protein LOC107045392 [Diachasma alloeum]
MDPFLEKDISRTEVCRNLRSSKCAKAPGPDGIANEFLKHLPPDWVQNLTKMLNNAWKEKNVPDCWPKAALSMLFKKGDPADPMCYRGIALINNILKMYTGILHSHLEAWMASRNILPEEQAGVRRGRGCIDQTFSLVTAVQTKLRLTGNTIYCIFIDFRRAFDLVPHQLLWEKLGKLGVSGKTLRVFRNIYDNASVKVRLGMDYTEDFEVTEGTLQGDKLSPLLFIAYIADFIEFLERKNIQCLDIGGKSLRALLYADDTVVLARSLTDARYILKCLPEYFDANGLVVHTGKTEVLVCRPSGRVRAHEKSAFFYKDQLVKTVEQCTYLGTVLDGAMSGNQGAISAMQKARIAIATANSILRRTKAEDWHSRIKLFDSLVSYTLLYGIQTWGPDHLNEIEKIQTDYFKRIFLLPSNTPGYHIRLKLGIQHLALRALNFIWDWICKVLKMNHERWPYICLMETIRLSRSPACIAKFNWVSRVSDIFASVGLPSMFDHLDLAFWMERRQTFIEALESKLRATYYASLLCSSSSQVQLIRSPSDVTANYLRFRGGIHATRVAIQLRLANVYVCGVVCNGLTYKLTTGSPCRHCDLNSLETLEHFLLVCPA